MRSKLLVGGLGAAVAFLLAANPVVADAAGQITGAMIKNNTIKGKDVKDGSLTGKDLKDGSLAGSDVADNSLKGADIDESSLVLPALPAVAEGPTGTGILTGGLDTVATITFTAPANGFVRVTGSASWHTPDTPNGWLDAYLYQDATKIQGNYWDSGENDNNYDLRQSIDGVAPVTAGSHTWTLRVQDNGASPYAWYNHSQVIVEFFPTGSAPTGSPLRPGSKQP